MKEIDDACERVTLASTAAEHVYTVASGNQDDFRNEKVPSFHRPKSKNGARQSTLDGFAGSSKKFGDGGETSSRATMTVDDGEKLYVNIDAEMAKTWIYPGRHLFLCRLWQLLNNLVEICFCLSVQILETPPGC